MPNLILRTRVPDASTDGSEWRINVQPMTWRPDVIAVIVCDMWDALDCVSAARRVEEMAPHMNRVLSDLRAQHALIIHAPSSCMDFYRNTTGRRRALESPHADAPIAFDWNSWNAEKEAPLPMVVDDSEPCSCDSADRCFVGEPVVRGTRQIATIDIADEDAITDDGQEVYNLLTQRKIDSVILMGVHTNRCVLGRPFGIRQLVYLGKKPILCRDLTDSYHKDLAGHFRGTRRIVEHIERHWCPTITSDQLVDGQPFRFRDDPFNSDLE